MNIKFNFIYFGNSLEIIEKSKRFFEKIKFTENISFHTNSKVDTELLYSLNEDINLIFLDFDMDNNEFHNGLAFLQMVRKTKLSKKYFFSITAGNDKSTLALRFLFRAGINTIFNKDGDLELFLYQFFYIAYDDLYIPKYATTKKFFAKTLVSLPIFLEYFSREKLGVASDFTLPQEFEINNFLDTYTLKGLKSNQLESSPNSFARYFTEYELDFPNEWENNKTDSFDTISTQLKNSLEGIEIKNNILIISSNDYYINLCKTYPAIFLKNNLTPLEISVESLKEELPLSNYDLIFLLETPTIDQDQRFDLVTEITNYYKLRYSENLPFLIIAPSNSTTEAMTKALRYNRLMTNPSNLTEEIVCKLIDSFTKKEKIVKSDHYEIPILSQVSLNFLNLQLVVTSLNEFRITFITQEDLPLYSFFQIDLGVILNVLIVPPTMFLSKVGDKIHYMGFFFGMSEKTLQKLRILVNHFLTIKVESLDSKFFSMITDDMKKQLPAHEEKENSEDQNLTDQEIKSDIKGIKKEEEKISKYKKGYYTKM